MLEAVGAYMIVGLSVFILISAARGWPYKTGVWVGSILACLFVWPVVIYIFYVTEVIPRREDPW